MYSGKHQEKIAESIGISYAYLRKKKSEVHDIISRRLSSNQTDIRETLLHAQTEVRFKEKGSFLVSIKPFLAAAIVACILLFGYLFFFNANNSLYELPAMQSEIVHSQELNSQYEQAEKLYNKKSYSESRDLFNSLIAFEPQVVQYQYYAAMTYMGEENWEESKEKLIPIAEGQSIFKDEAKYYLAISLENLGYKSEAIAILKSVPSQGI